MALSKRDIEMIFRAETDAAQRPVAELTSDVKRLRQTLEDLAKSTGKTDKSLEELAQTTRELEKAQNELGTARTLLTQLNAQNNALDNAAKAAEAAAAKYAQLKTQVDGAEKPTKRLVQSMEAAERKMQATNQRLEEQRKQYAEVKGSIEGIIGPVDNLQDAFRTVAVAQREITQGLAAAKGSVAGFKAEISDTKVELDRLAQVDAFRKLAADSVAADTAADRIKAGLDGSTTAAVRLSDAIQQIVNPARAAAVTLEGMESRLDAVNAKMAGKKISVNEWNELNNELVSIQANLGRVTAEVDTFVAQQSRVDNAAAAFDNQAKKVRDLAAAEVNASTSVEQLTADLKREEAELARLGGALDRETAKLREFGTALGRVGIDSKNLPAAIQRIEATATRAAPAIERVTNAVSPAGRKGFLGLDPFQLQNLSYQVNDVFTSLGSGAPPLQVLAQQGGQILQIFPGILSTFARFLPIIAPLALGFTVLAGSVSEANTQIQTLRTANTVIASLGETNGYTAQKFQEIVTAFRDLGVSAEEATASAKEFVTKGLNPKAVDDYIIAAKNLATVQGIDVKTATEELTSAFTAGADEVLKLDDKYQFLTDTQRDNLVASKDTKNEYNEVNKAFTALYNKMQAGANASKGPMTEAANTLRAAWRGLLETFADTGAITAVTTVISKAITGFAFLINLAKRVGVVFKGSLDAYNQWSKFGPAVGLAAMGAKIGANIGSGDYAAPISAAMADTNRQAAAANRNLTAVQVAPGADAGAGSAGRQTRLEKQYEKDRKQAEKDRKKAARDAEADAKRRAREAEQLARQYANEQDQLTAALSRMTIEALRGTQAPLEQQLELARQSVDEQFKALEDRLSEFREKFGSDAKIGGMSQTDYGAALARQKAQIVLARQLGVYENNVNDLLKARTERLKAVKDQQDAGTMSAEQALRAVQEVTSEMGPQIDAAITAARGFIAALTPSAETQALLAKFERIQAQGGTSAVGGTIEREQVKSGVSQGEKEINDLLERRANLVASANALYESGAYNYTQKEAAIKQAFTDTNGEIQKAIVSAYEFLEANKAMLPPDVYTNALAQLRLYNDQLKYTDTLMLAVKQTAVDALANGLMGLFDSFGKGVADMITGAKTFGGFLKSMGKAALQFAADFAMAIAKAILQIYALRIAKSLIGGFHGGGTVGDYGGGQMKLARSIGPADLSGVPRYHEGTQGAGLKSNEMLAVLEKGERVQTEEQQHMEKKRLDNARKGGGGRGIRQVLAFGDSEIAGAMTGPAGEEVVVTHIRRNRPRIRQALGID